MLDQDGGLHLLVERCVRVRNATPQVLQPLLLVLLGEGGEEGGEVDVVLKLGLEEVLLDVLNRLLGELHVIILTSARA